MEVYNMFISNKPGNMKAFVKLKTQEGLVIDGFKVIQGQKGEFVGWPQKAVTKDGNTEYFPTVFTGEERDNQPIKDKINELILEEYIKKMESNGVKVTLNSSKKNDWIAKGTNSVKPKPDAQIITPDDDDIPW